MKVEFKKDDFIAKTKDGEEFRMLSCFGRVLCNNPCEKCWTDYRPEINNQGFFIPEEFVNIAKDNLYNYKTVYYTSQDWKNVGKKGLRDPEEVLAKAGLDY